MHRKARWLPTLRRYLIWVTTANLVWEFAHVPLYTIWDTGTAGKIAFAALHCTGGDILIALSSVMLALFLAGDSRWPTVHYGRVAILAVMIGFSYTLFSEWLNVEIRKTWAYRDAMPILPILEVGLSPILQWIIVPIAAFLWAARRAACEESTAG